MLDAMELDRRLAFATDLAREAGLVALARQPTGRHALSFKGHQDYLTEVDGAVELLIRAALLRAFPQDSFLGEEGGGDLGRSLWVVDPIDGTANFARGRHFWCISIAHMTDGVADIGVVHAPALNRLYAARRGGGARCDGRSIRASTIVKPSEAMIEIDWTATLSRSDFLATIDRALAAGFEFRRTGAGALALAQVAEGVLDGFIEGFTKPWDALAGCVLIREAGGLTTHFEHELLARMGNGVVAAGPGLFEALFRAAALDLPPTPQS
ncbi:MAG: inositol monophosphatase [Alphaproteobacteria bacterium]|nr:inositol monophosphatase [Alphaproteobacteria bacterium]